MTPQTSSLSRANGMTRGQEIRRLIAMRLSVALGQERTFATNRL